MVGVSTLAYDTGHRRREQAGIIIAIGQAPQFISAIGIGGIGGHEAPGAPVLVVGAGFVALVRAGNEVAIGFFAAVNFHHHSFEEEICAAFVAEFTLPSVTVFVGKDVAAHGTFVEYFEAFIVLFNVDGEPVAIFSFVAACGGRGSVGTNLFLEGHTLAIAEIVEDGIFRLVGGHVWDVAKEVASAAKDVGCPGAAELLYLVGIVHPDGVVAAIEIAAVLEMAVHGFEVGSTNQQGSGGVVDYSR